MLTASARNLVTDFESALAFTPGPLLRLTQTRETFFRSPDVVVDIFFVCNEARAAIYRVGNENLWLIQAQIQELYRSTLQKFA
jgi:hypothetical protein